MLFLMNTETHSTKLYNIKVFCLHTFFKKKGKEVPLKAWSYPEGSRKLRFRDYMTTAQDGGNISPKHRPPLLPGNAPCTHFF